MAAAACDGDVPGGGDAADDAVVAAADDDDDDDAPSRACAISCTN